MVRLIELPTHIKWSAPYRSYDLDQRQDLVAVYEMVMREGADKDVRRFIDVETLIDIWDEMFLPITVETAWADYLERVRGVKVHRKWASLHSKPG